MQNGIETLKWKRFSMKLCVSMICLVMLLSLTWQVRKVNAEINTKITIDPAYALLNVGDNLTITVTLANVPELFGWQVALKYNGSVANCTGTWIPDNNVFAGKTVAEMPVLFGNDTSDGMQYAYASSQLLTPPIAVTTGIMFKANFTGFADGQTAILIATKSNPVHFSAVDWDRYYSSLIDYSLADVDFVAESGTVVCGGVRANPVALFSVVPPTVDNSTYYVLDGHKPVGGVPFVQTYQGYENLFNASASHDPNPNGTIARYLWDFGDGNQTQTTVPIVTHIYNVTGQLTATLTVVDNGNPPLESVSLSRVIVVGLVLDYANWAPLLYTLVAIITIVVVVAVVRRVGNYKRKPRSIRQHSQ